MKVISIQQPWAWAILNCGKDIENRDWATALRGRVLIHTGKKYDYSGDDFLRSLGFNPLRDQIQCGGLVGSVEIVGCVTYSNSKWFFGRFGFVLRNPISFPFIHYRGQLGFFDFPRM